MRSVGLATCAEARGHDEDMAALVAALRRTGVEPVVVDWDAPSDWSTFDLVCLRSTWDYHRRLPEFLQWIALVDGATRLVNDADIVRWSTDKRYLRDLHAVGVPVVPTTFLVPGDEVRVPSDGEFVVKPTVSAGSNDTARYRGSDPVPAERHVSDLLQSGRGVMIQPYIASVDVDGETGMVFFGGEFSHAFRKGPILNNELDEVGGLFAAEDISARRPSPDELALAEQVLDALPTDRDRLAYARIDVVVGPDGPLVLEVELAEPSVYLVLESAAADRFAVVLADLAR